MSLSEQIMNEVHALPDVMQREVLDFARFLRIKEEVTLDSAMDQIITENIEAFRVLAK